MLPAGPSAGSAPASPFTPRLISPAARVVHLSLAALFLFGAVVQWNDPDPLRWGALYLAAAGACVLAALGRSRWPLPAAVGVASLLWAAALAPGVLSEVAPGELFAAWEMKDVRVEEGRETYGLLLIAAWMAVLTAMDLSRRARSRAAAGDVR